MDGTAEPIRTPHSTNIVELKRNRRPVLGASVADGVVSAVCEG